MLRKTSSRRASTSSSSVSTRRASTTSRRTKASSASRTIFMAFSAMTGVIARRLIGVPDEHTARNHRVKVHERVERFEDHFHVLLGHEGSDREPLDRRLGEDALDGLCNVDGLVADAFALARDLDRHDEEAEVRGHAL